MQPPKLFAGRGPDRRTRRQTLQAISGVVLTAGVTGMAGARGNRIEIDGPTVIDEPGHYELVDDINAGEDPAIKIIADDVTLEGNGHTINAYYIGISIDSVSNLTIQNLTIGGGVYEGISANDTESSLVENVDAGGKAHTVGCNSVKMVVIDCNVESTNPLQSNTSA